MLAQPQDSVPLSERKNLFDWRIGQQQKLEENISLRDYLP
jgi:hypothetical protein